MARENLIDELDRICYTADFRRAMLYNSAEYSSKAKKNLTILAGVLALLSASAIASVLVKWIGSSGIQIFAAVTAFLSGITSLILSGYKEEDVSKTYSASSKFLLLRDHVTAVLLTPEISEKELHENILKFQTQYADLDEKYSKYYQAGGNVIIKLFAPRQPEIKSIPHRFRGSKFSSDINR